MINSASKDEWLQLPPGTKKVADADTVAFTPSSLLSPFAFVGTNSKMSKAAADFIPLIQAWMDGELSLQDP
jgi:hypothetical protein